MRKPAEQHVLETVAALKALADPLRLRILLALAQEAKTVKQLAAELGSGPTKLYYHVNMLERNGLIEVVERQLVSGIEQRRYAAVAESWTVSPDMASSIVPSGVIGALLNVVRAELELALDEPSSVPPGEPGSTVPMLLLTRLALAPGDVRVAQERLFAALDEYRNDAVGADGKFYNTFLTAYLAPSELRRAP
jgi:DNA-binding transcriptional ArsR family regulator